MDKKKIESKKLYPLKITGIILFIFLIYTFMIEKNLSLFTDIEFLFGSLIIMIPIYLIVMLIIKMEIEVQEKKYEQPIKRWYEWTFYVFGLVTGLLSPIFWLYQYVIYLQKEKETNFIKENPAFHRRAYYWGIFIAGFMVIVLFIIFMI